MDNTVRSYRPAKARTLATFEEGTRKKTAGMAGYQIGYWRDYAQGSGTNSPLEGDNSFIKSTKQSSGAMYAGVAYRYMNIYLHSDILTDMKNGKIPDSYIKERRRRIKTYMMEKNWAAIGKGDGQVARAASAAGTTLTCTATNGRGLSKGVMRLFVSTAEDPIWYSAINDTTDAEVARFFVTARLTATTCTVNFTGGVGAIADLNTDLAIVKYNTGWKKELIGLNGHVSDDDRIYQGANTADDSFLKNPSVAAGNAAVTPTMVDTAKNIARTRSNDENGRDGFVCHLTPGNWNVLCAFGYTSRTYNAEGGKASKTFGLPDEYIDGDTVFVPDPDYEDGEMILRERAPYFEYVHTPFRMKTVDGIGRHEYIGSGSAGSREEYENYVENVNIVWDGAGKDGDMEGDGNPNRAVVIENIALPAVRQVTYGIL